MSAAVPVETIAEVVADMARVIESSGPVNLPREYLSLYDALRRALVESSINITPRTDACERQPPLPVAGKPVVVDGDGHGGSKSSGHDNPDAGQVPALGSSLANVKTTEGVPAHV